MSIAIGSGIAALSRDEAERAKSELVKLSDERESIERMKRLTTGFLNIDKPAGMTSHDVVYKLRQWTKIKRIGHAGTLDPDATGVLPIAIGPTSRLISYLASEKIYLTEIQLGTITTTDDLSGAIVEQRPLENPITRQQIEAVLSNYIGQLDQKPPLYSAVQKNGQRLYDLARHKLEKQAKYFNDNSQMAQTMDSMLSSVESRSVNIEKIELLQIDLPIIKLRVFCSTGTYIRSLARDIGVSIGCGACLKSLRREKSGPFLEKQSTSLPEIENLIENGHLQNILLPPHLVLPTNIIYLELPAAVLLAHGHSLSLDASSNTLFPGAHISSALEQYCLAIYKPSPGDETITLALCLLTKDKIIKPKIVLALPEDLKNLA